MSEHHYQELCRLKGLTSLPSVQNVLERLINEQHAVREPIKRSKVLSTFFFYFFKKADLIVLLFFISYRHKYKHYILRQVMLGVRA